MTENAEDREITSVDSERLVQEEAEAAAAQAAAIGGPNPDPDLDPAERPLAEGGGGVAEGFELAESDLVGQASHESVGLPPTDAAFTPEPEAEDAGAVYGEPDGVDATEVVRDPLEGEDGPGIGPGLTAER